MGMYIYRVTAKLVKLVDGRKAHICQYAYKPCSDERVNGRAHFRTGCYSSERMKLKSDLLVVLGTHGHEGNLYHNPHGLRTFHDDCTFGTEAMPKLGTVQRASQFSQLYKVVA